MPPKKTAPRRVNKKKKVAKLSKPMVKAVKKIIDGNIEDKYKTVYPDATGSNPFNSALGSYTAGLPGIGKAYSLLPAIAQGLDEFDRIGNKLRPKSLVVKYTVSISPDYVGSTQTICRLLTMTDKSVKDYTNWGDIEASLTNEMFNLGNGSYQGASTVPQIVNWRINKKRFNVTHDKMFVLEKGAGDTPKFSNSYLGAITTHTNREVHEFTMRIPIPKVLNYPEGAASLYPSNFAPFWTMVWTQANIDNSSASNSWLASQPLVNFVAHFDYENA